MTEVISNKELSDKILEGARKLNDAVSSTLGPYGKTTIITNSEGKLSATKDGVTVAKSFNQLEDYGENAGAQSIKQVAIKSGNEAGDGTTTSTLLAYSILDAGYKTMKIGSNPVHIKKGIDLAVKEVIEGLKNIAIDISEDSQIKEVATISGNNDEEIGTLISTALDKVGRDGLVSIEKSKTGETQLEVVEGMQFDRGYKSPYFVTDNDKMNAVLEKPLILIYNGRINSAQDILPALQLASISENKTLLIIAEDIEGEALSTLVVNKMRGIVNSVAVKAPEFGDRRLSTLEDIAMVTGGKVIDNNKGIKLDKLSETELKQYLGTSRTVNVDKEKTTIIDGNCKEEDLKSRVDSLKTQMDSTKSLFEKEKLQERIGRLSGGVALISVGGGSEVEINEKYDRVEDALFATKAALEEGILPGGGVALIHARNNIKFNSKINDINLGKKIIYDSVSQPFYKILSNSGMNLEDSLNILTKLSKSKNKWLGYNLESNKVVNMKENGILDPLKVVKLALANSSSVAGTLLTTSALVYEKLDKKEENQQMMF